ncbi:hypothetical protein Tco_1121177 [Tanacetum coccineum]|uniref:Uncharacterized protein n=1 Tax=Tanacetum coccineum TaxID=301880 RepID=A0ABQ5IWZ2_9ASTR
MTDFIRIELKFSGVHLSDHSSLHDKNTMSFSREKGSPYHLVDKDGMLDRLKFINKGDIYQVYGKCIPGRGIGSQEGKSTATPKEPTKPRKKPSKKKQVPRDESPESEGELENRQVSRKIRTLRAVAARLELANQKVIKESQHTSRLKHKTGSSSEGTGVSLGVPDELTGKSVVSDEGVGTSPKVSYETEYDYEAQSDDDVSSPTHFIIFSYQ